jgi:hypothetical protein
MERGYSSFHPNSTDSREDAFIGGFFVEQAVYTSDTRDEHGAMRYGGEAEVAFYFNGHLSPIRPDAQEKRFGIKYLPGLAGASEQTVSFHLKDRIGGNITAMLYRYHALLQGWCEND